MPLPTPLISGAQTSVDRAALEFAITHALPHGGLCPKGRPAEDYRIPPRYQLTNRLRRTASSARAGTREMEVVARG